MKNPTNNLSRDLELFDAQPPEVQEAFQFLLATSMYEAAKFELLSVAELTVGRTVQCSSFTDGGAVRPKPRTLESVMSVEMRRSPK